MTVMRRLEKLLGWAVVPNLTRVLVIGQALFALLVAVNPQTLQQMPLVWSLVAQGEVWRVLTFVFVPLSMAFFPLFLFFALYLMWMFGHLLEAEWGAFHFNLYVWIAVLLSALSALLDPGAGVGSFAISTTIFLAAAWLIPDFQLMLFLIVPVKIKYLAMITWFFIGVQFFRGVAQGDWAGAGLALVSVGNFLLFFGRELVAWVSRKRRGMAERDRKARARETALHRCSVCRRTELTHPDLTFRYVPDAAGEAVCYCEDDLP